MGGVAEVAVADDAEPGADLDARARPAVGVGERAVGGAALVGVDGGGVERDDLPVHDPDSTDGPRRILVAGSSGAGKSTVAAAIGERLGLPYVELDALFHGPGWVPRPEFAAEAAALAAGGAWVTEWQYSLARPVLLARAELLVWLDVPRWRVLVQLTARTVRRRVRRVELWNGNVEPPLRTVLTDRDHILRWAWRTHADTARRIAAARADDRCPPVVRLRSRAEISAWLAAGPPAPGPGAGSPTPAS